MYLVILSKIYYIYEFLYEKATREIPSRCKVRQDNRDVIYPKTGIFVN